MIDDCTQRVSPDVREWRRTYSLANRLNAIEDLHRQGLALMTCVGCYEVRMGPPAALSRWLEEHEHDTIEKERGGWIRRLLRH